MTTTMKPLALAAVLATAAALAPSARAQTTYPDATGDVFTDAGGGILDITSVEVSNDTIDLIFKINLAGNPVATDWGKYMIALDSVEGGATTGNGWGRPINMASGVDHWVGVWVDGGNGGNRFSWDGASWVEQTPGNVTVSKDSSSVTVRFPYASLGLTVDDAFEFDIYTSGGGGGDGAIDALSTNGIAAGDWGSTFTTENSLTYTISGIAPPTNQISFTVDMEVPIAIFANNPSSLEGFDPESDRVFVRGSFNGWATQPAYELFRVGSSSIFSNTVEIVGHPGTQISYKFYGDPFPVPQEETPLLICNATRSLIITNSTQSAPPAAWSDRRLSDPTNNITFQVDMTLERAVGRFDPDVNSVYVRGSFNNWGTFGPLTNKPAPDTNIFVGVVTVENWPIGACVEYKYWHNGPSGTAENWEGGGNRQFNILSSDHVVPVRAFNDADVCDVLEQTNFVTFSVNLADAVATDTTVYDGTQDVYLNGDFANWWAWGAPPDEYRLTKDGDIYSITLPLPPGNNIRLEYKYSLGGADNEAGFAVNHVRYIRTQPGQENYTLPQDTFIGTNEVSVAERTEPKFGNLVAVPGAPGQVQIQWLGLKCVQLESTTNLTSSDWITYPATDGLGSTNWSASGLQEYFRLLDKSP